MPGKFQSSFINFHESIKLFNTDENSILRKKRDAILERMRNGGLTFTSFNQGSYAMGTGVVPLNADYDIDVGIIFTGDTKPSDPLIVKRWVYDKVLGHTSNVEWLRNCIRVQYIKAGEPTYHVDLPVYWKDKQTGELSLAVGKKNSDNEHKDWQSSDPQGLINKVNSHLSGEDRSQFRRVVRYFKRWKDSQFPKMGNAAPVGIGITVAALNGFSVAKDWGATTSAGYNDLQATLNLANYMRENFKYTYNNGEYASRLVQTLPVSPQNDVFKKMTNQQMKEFKERLDKLSKELETAQSSYTSSVLAAVFGPDFPA